MNEELIRRCELLVTNRNAIRQASILDSDTMMLAGSSAFTGLGLEVDPERIKACFQVLKQNAGILSDYRGNVKMPLLCKMALADDPQKYLDGIEQIKTYLKEIKWIGGEYRILAAMTIYDRCEPDRWQEAVHKTKELFQKMQENHPWLTSNEDIPFAAMLAVSDMDTEALTAEIETCYQILKEKFHDKNAVQSLSHVLAVDRAPAEEKCSRTEQIFDLLKERKHRYGTGFELAVLGTLCQVDLPAETIADEIIEADEYLKTQKGFGNLTMGEHMRRMYAALMVMDTHVPPASRSHESVISTSIALVIAMEICMMIVMTSMMTTTVVSAH